MSEPASVESLASGQRARSTAPRKPAILIAGNPNAGKTTIFNALTGHNARVGNYPGVTVERRVGALALTDPAGNPLFAELIDVPGTYSLSARSPDEQIAIGAILGLDENPEPALAVVVVDAGQLARNLYLVLQLIEMQIPLVVVLNMIDEVADDPPSAEALSEALGVPCVATNARRGEGLDELRTAVGAALGPRPLSPIAAEYPDAVREAVDRIAETLPSGWRGSVERDRALGLWALTSLDADDELLDIPDELRRRCERLHEENPNRDLDREIIAARYRVLDRIERQVRQGLRRPRPVPPSERIDRIILHPVYGFALFLALMTVLFQSLFTWADPAIGLIEDAVTRLQAFALGALPPGFFSDLLTDGVLGGVGNVVVFLPQLLLLFFFIGILEDSGYMARVAYLMDRVMKSLGLHGRAFVPMMSGFACAVPAILSTRTMEHRRDRLLTMMVIPLMTCSARLPVYTLLIAALFPPTTVFGWVPVQGLLMVGMYLFATLIALVSAAVLGRTAIRGRRIPLILELPPYRLPKFSVTSKMMWDRTRTFLTEAGTLILVCTVGLWFLLSHPVAPETAPAVGENVAAQRTIEHSYGGRIGKALEPAIAPLGFDWKIGVGIVGAFAAREVFVSTMGIVYGAGAPEEDLAPLRDRMRAETRSDGRPAYTPLVGLSLMVFFALACQCVSTLAVVARETKSYKWPAFMFAYMTALAWVASFIVYQGGRLLGF